MQNTKIQTLWQLCQELKSRREVLVQKMNQNQSHLDEQQWAISEQVHNLKQENHALFEQVGYLSEQVLNLRTQILENNEANNTKQNQEDTHSLSINPEELTGLHARYTQLATDLDTSEHLYQSRTALLEQLQKTNQNVHYEFQELKKANVTLKDDLSALEEKSNQLIEMVEQYRQAALEAYAEVEKAQSTTEPDESPPEYDSKAEAARNAVRKKIIILLRHRLGKVPRDISSALKDVNTNKVMDHLFELAMVVENIEDFRYQLI